MGRCKVCGKETSNKFYSQLQHNPKPVYLCKVDNHKNNKENKENSMFQFAQSMKRSK